ncbi:pyrroline-5-carboxylate reductase [Aeromicrobium sp. CF4.19]|uniref:pyrroline-5-carboxylate reductase n=1 Tax=Aeromicrobium sp. CF4.19 TaxID=3373082 RepID=UPI003EE52683
MSLRIAVLGGGVMGETLLSAIRSAGHDDVVVAEKFPERARELREKHGVEVLDSAAAVVGADVVLVVVKPQDVASVLAEVAGSLEPSAVVVSLAAGVRTDTIEAAVPDGVAVVRAMPNTPAVVGEGMFGVSAGAACPAAQLDVVVDLLSTGGEVVVVPEGQQDALTAVSGSGPAYVFYLAEAMITGGVEAGLDEATARALATQTLVGAAKLLATSEDTPAELRRRVTSPNGTTAAAIETFDERGVGAGVAAGVRAAARRSAELSGS